MRRELILSCLLLFYYDNFVIPVESARINASFTCYRFSDVKLDLRLFNQNLCAISLTKIESGIYRVYIEFNDSLHHLEVGKDYCHENSSRDGNNKVIGNLSIRGEACRNNSALIPDSPPFDLKTFISMCICLGLMLIVAIIVTVVRCARSSFFVPEDLQRIEIFREIFMRRFIGRPNNSNAEAVAEKLLILERFGRVRTRSVGNPPTLREENECEEVPRYQQMRFNPTPVLERLPAINRTPSGASQRPKLQVTYHRALDLGEASRDIPSLAEPKADTIRTPVPKPRTRREPYSASSLDAKPVRKVYIREAQHFRNRSESDGSQNYQIMSNQSYRQQYFPGKYPL